MARRLFNGRAFSENGWPYVDQGSCTWVKIPGAEHVTLQIQNGPPLAVLRAFAADFHAHVEPLRDEDSACWTYDNKVATSNHPGGTSMDLNWNGADGRTFRYGIPENVAYPGDKARKMRELIAFYEGVVFCGGDWSIRDFMHFQMGSGTYDSKADKPTQKTLDFIARKIRADGFSTFQRGSAPVPGDPAQVLSRATGVSINKATEILPAVVNGLRRAAANNVNRIAMWLAQMGHESAGFVYTEEIQSGDESTDRWKYKGRTWIQITWRSNYAGFSKWCYALGLVPTQDYFVAVPKELAQLKWAGLGPAWYWTVARPDINALSDKQDLFTVSARINGINPNTGEPNGMIDRRNRYSRALALGDQLLTLIGEDELSAEAEQMIKDLHRAESDSLSMYAEGPEERCSQVEAYAWDERVESSALRGEDWAISKVARAATGTLFGVLRNGQPDQFLARHAAVVLIDVENRNPVALQRYLAQKGAAV